MNRNIQIDLLLRIVRLDRSIYPSFIISIIQMIDYWRYSEISTRGLTNLGDFVWRESHILSISFIASVDILDLFESYARFGLYLCAFRLIQPVDAYQIVNSQQFNRVNIVTISLRCLHSWIYGVFWIRVQVFTNSRNKNACNWRNRISLLHCICLRKKNRTASMNFDKVPSP